MGAVEGPQRRAQAKKQQAGRSEKRCDLGHPNWKKSMALDPDEIQLPDFAGRSRDGPNPFSPTFQFKCVVNGAHGTFRMLLINDARNFNLRSADHLNVNSLIGKGAEHP